MAKGFPAVLKDPTDLEARSWMQLGASFAGLAIETSMLGAAHATANPLTARHKITHGQAVGMMLPAVIRFNGRHHAAWYADLMHELDPTVGVQDAPEQLASFVESCLKLAGLATRFDELQIPSDHIAELATDALKQWTVITILSSWMSRRSRRSIVKSARSNQHYHEPERKPITSRGIG